MAEESVTIPTVSIDVAAERLRPRLVSLLFFDYVNLTGSNKVNLIGVFDHIRINPKTKKTHPFGVFIRVGQAFHGIVKIAIFDPNAIVIAGLSFGLELPADLPEKPFQMQGIYRIEFEATVEGVYWFDVSYEDKSIGGAGLLVEFMEVETSKDEHTTGDA